MTENNFNVKESSEEEQYQKIISDFNKYTLDKSRYDDLENLAGMYESLHVLLQPFDVDDQVSHIIGLLGFINNSFFECLETLEPYN